MSTIRVAVLGALALPTMAALAQAPASGTTASARRSPVIVAAVPASASAAAWASDVEFALDNAVDGDPRVKRLDVVSRFQLMPSDADTQAESLLQKAKSAYDNLDFDGAVQATSEAINGMDSRADADPKRVAYAWCLLGASQLLNGQDNKATSSFRRANAAAPSYSPDPSVFAPDQIEAFRRATVESAPGPRGSVLIRKESPEVRAFVDGAAADNAPPGGMSVRPGRHRVVLMRPGYQMFARFVEVAASETAEVQGKLDPLPSMTRYRAALDQIAKESSEGNKADAAFALAADYGAEYFFIALVGEKKGKLDVQLSVVDGVRRGIRFSATRAVNRDSPTFATAVHSWATEMVESLSSGATTVQSIAEGPPTPIPWLWVGAGAGAAVVVGAVVTALLLPRSRPDGFWTTGIP